MIFTRKAEDRGTANYGWLLARYAFSFAEYFDPNHMGFRTLRVLNEDRIAPKSLFPMHDHRDMEILTYVIEGAVQHKDSMGNTSIVKAGEFQLMSAGSGVTHSEENPSTTEELHLLQIWIRPDERGLTPAYQQASFDDRTGALRLVVSPEGAGGSLQIHQDARVYSAVLESGASVIHELGAQRHAWLHVVSGSLLVGETRLKAGDSAGISEESSITITAEDNSEFLLFDLA